MSSSPACCEFLHHQSALGAGGTAAAHPPGSQSVILGRAFVGGSVGWASLRGFSGPFVPTEGDSSECVVLNCTQNLRNAGLCPENTRRCYLSPEFGQGVEGGYGSTEVHLETWARR